MGSGGPSQLHQINKYSHTRKKWTQPVGSQIPASIQLQWSQLLLLQSVRAELAKGKTIPIYQIPMLACIHSILTSKGSLGSLVNTVIPFLGVCWKLRQRQHCLPQVKPANPSSVYQTEANSVVPSHITEDGTLWMFRYDYYPITCNLFNLIIKLIIM